MNRMSFCVSLAVSILLSLPLSLAQQSSQTAVGIVVPRLIRFSGAVNDVPGQPRSGVVGITFALYKDQAGGAALWLETQNVSLDAQGRYTVLLGASSAEGMPVELFTANGARWLGVQPEGQAEQRVLLVSVPYALKAADAETLGGMPASSFVLAAPLANSGSGSSGSQTGGNTSANSAAGSSASGISPNATCTSGSCAVSTTAPGGTANFLPLFTDPTTVQNSVLSQNPCPFDNSQTCLGVGTTSPARILDVNGEIRVEGGNLFLQRDKTDLSGRRNWAWGTETFNVGDVSLFVSSSNTGYASISPVFTALSNGFMGIGVATPHANLEIAGSVGGGLLVDSPSTITGSGAGLTSVPAASLTGTLPAATLTGVNGSGLTNVNAAMLAGNPPSAFASTGSNTFTGNQTVTGNLTVSGSLSGGTASLNLLALPSTTSASVGVITLGGTPFLHNYASNKSANPLSNTFVGVSAGNMTTTSAFNENTAVGFSALTAITTGYSNAALGTSALTANTSGYDNSAFGYSALLSNTTGYQNAAFGAGVLGFNTTGYQNAAFGTGVLGSNTTGAGNSAFGTSALTANTTGYQNAAFGWEALYSNTTAIQNAAFGFDALNSNTTGSGNSAFGFAALPYLATGNSNTVLGYEAGSNLIAAESNNIYIGNPGVTGESNAIRIGAGGQQTATYIVGINGATSASGTAVFVNSSNQLGTVTSSRRFKHQIADMGGESDLLMKLRPVAFYYKPELDETQTRQYGLVAEEVAQVAPQLVVYDKDGAPQTVRYHFVNAMLLNAVQKQQRRLEEQGRAIQRQQNTIDQQQSTIAQQQAEIQDLAARMAKLEALLAAQR